MCVCVCLFVCVCVRACVCMCVCFVMQEAQGPQLPPLPDTALDQVTTTRGGVCVCGDCVVMGDAGARVWGREASVTCVCLCVCGECVVVGRTCVCALGEA